MPRKLRFSKKLTAFFSVFFSILFLMSLSVSKVQALTPCTAPSAAGYRARTISLSAGFGGWILFPALAVGDFNGDGKADVAAPAHDVNDGSNSQLRIYLGDGSGGFTFGNFYTTAVGRPSSIATADFNNDGKLDLVVGNESKIQILAGSGTGSFSSVITYAVGGYALTTGDFNADGKQDIASIPFAAVPGRASVLMGFGTATFAAPVDTPTADFPRTVKTGDFNGDGKPDLITANGSSVSVLLNTGTGNFALPANFNTGATHSTYLTLGDFNNDTKLDVAVANDAVSGVPYGAPSISILLGNGMGGLGAATTLDLGVNFSRLVTGDFNGDGNLDVAGVTRIQVTGISDPVPGTIVTLAGDGSGGFTISNTTGVGYSPQGLASGDFNSDGRPDLIAGNSGRSRFVDGDGSVLLGSCNAPHIKSDYDGDGKADVAVWRPSDGNWRILQSSDNTLRIQQWGGGSFGDKPVPGDYDGDGKADLAVWRPSNGAWYVLRSSDNSLYAVAWGTSGDRPVPGDYDGDRKTDLAVYRPSTGAWYVLRSSDSTFYGIGFGLSTDKTVQGDYDGDGKTDLAVWRPSSGYWYVLNSADSSFLATAWGTNGDTPVPGDYDGDSRSDYVTYRPSTNRFYVYRPDAPSQYLEYTLGTNADTPAPADYDGDGLTDITMWRPTQGVFSYIKSFTGQQFTSSAVGTTGDIEVSTPYAPE